MKMRVCGNPVSLLGRVSRPSAVSRQCECLCGPMLQTALGHAKMALVAHLQCVYNTVQL